MNDWGKRWIALVADSDDRFFYEVFARDVGCTVDLNDSTGDLKRKIVQALVNGDQVLILDEAHTLFGTGKKPIARRADWLRTALLNIDIPVVLIFTGMKYAERLGELRKVAEWNAKQFEGRRGAYYMARKPSAEELVRIAMHYLRGQCAEGAMTAAQAAIASEHRIPTVIRVANEAIEIAHRHGRTEVLAEDIDEAASVTLGYEALVRSAEQGLAGRKGSGRTRSADSAPAVVDAAPAPAVSESPFSASAMGMQRGREPASMPAKA